MSTGPGRVSVGWRPRRLAGWLPVAAVLAVVLVVAGGAGGREHPAYARVDARDGVVFTIASPEITESSSLAVSTVDPGLVYTTNDSGDDGTVYTLDASNGTVVGRTTLAGAAPLDVEAIAATADGSLIVADIGDNDADHSTADLYLIDQPGRGDRSVTAQRVDLTYVGGPRDAESVVYDDDTGRVFVVSKLLSGAKVYGTPPNVFDYQRARLRPVADAPPLATDATVLPGADFAVVRTYLGATVYAFPEWTKVTSFTLPAQQQGESITAPPSGDVVWVGSEGVRSRVLAVPLPDLADPATTPPTTSSAGPTGSPTGSGETSGGRGGDGSGGDGDGASAASDQPGGSDSSAQHVAQVVFVVSAAALIAIMVGLVIVAVRRRSLP